ncbi:MAG: hypothetical protein AAGH38_02220, partial [Pseudomonadota bacterium]
MIRFFALPIEVFVRTRVPVLATLTFLTLIGFSDARAYTPSVLGQADIETYGAIFDLQERGQWAAADKKIKEVEDPVLMGYVLEQRYMHPTKYRSSYQELRDWLSSYNDHPQAEKIYRLAL